MTVRITTAIHKGGVGKTAATINIAASAALEFGIPTAVLDFDFQCNATTGLLGNAEPPYSMLDVLEGRCTALEALVPAHGENLWVLPSSPELEHSGQFGSQKDFANAVLSVRQALVHELSGFSLVMIDTPPGGHFWYRVGLATAHYYLPVLWPDDYSARGLLKLQKTVDDVRRDYNPDLALAGLVVNYVRRTKGAEQYLNFFKECFEDAVLEPILPLRTNIPDAAAVGEPVLLYEQHSHVKADAGPLYQRLTENLLRRVGLLQTQRGAA